MGTLLLWVIHLLPVDRMRVHVYQSLSMLQEEFTDSLAIKGYEATLTGSFTDCLMLENTIYYNDAHSTFEQAMMMYRKEIGEGEGWAPGTSLEAYLENLPMDKEMAYARYWHGYLVVLKPLLLLTNVQTLRLMSAMAENLLLCGVVGICIRKHKNGLGAALAVSLMFTYVFVLYFSLSLSVCYYLVMAAIMVQLLRREKWKSQETFGIFFLIVGMCTAYFDLLTYPLVTLGFPLGIEIYCSEDDWKEQCKKMVRYILYWFVGYAGLWGLKWVITDVLLGAETIGDALMTVGERTNIVSGQTFWLGYMDVVKKNLSYFFNIPFSLAVITFVIWQMTVVRKRTLKKGKKVCLSPKLKNHLFSCCFLAALPFVWYMAAQNHSAEHSVYTCKIISVSVFSLFVFVTGGKTDVFTAGR